MPAPISENTAYLALGGNLGDVREAFRHVLARLAEVTGRPVRTSRLYQTVPWGEPNQPDFLNMVAEIQWQGSPRELLNLALTLERERHRDRSGERRWGPRTLDIDLLVVGPHSILEPDLSVPHPRLEQRTFVLAPLADLAPNLVPPGWRKTVRETLEGRTDSDTVSPLDERI